MPIDRRVELAVLPLSMLDATLGFMPTSSVR
jgi:hypothetical protein